MSIEKWSLSKIERLTGPFFNDILVPQNQENKNHKKSLSFATLGDAYLKAIVTEILYELSDSSNKCFTKGRDRFESRKHLEEVARLLEITRDKYIGHPGETIEAIIAAIYRNSGHNEAKNFVYECVMDKQITMNVLIDKSTNISYNKKRGKQRLPDNWPYGGAWY